MKDYEKHVDDMVNDAIACSDEIKKEGNKSAESGYRVIMALLIREILLRIDALCRYTAAIAGFLIGALLSKVLAFLFSG